MKKLLFICLLVTAASNLFAQNLPQYDQFKFDKKEDYKLADSAVLQTANFLLSAPIDQNTALRLSAGHFVMKWMEGTPEYTFTLDQNAIKYLSDNVDLMMLYMTSMAKYALQNKASDINDITLNGVIILLEYINNPANNVKKDKNLKKLSDANDRGYLESFLNL
jgi:hypothetical protein